MKKIQPLVVYISCSIICAFGTVYLLYGDLLPYHERFLAAPKEELPEKIRILLGLSVRAIGSLFLALGCLIITLIYKKKEFCPWGSAALLLPLATFIFISSKVDNIAIVYLCSTLFALNFLVTLNLKSSQNEFKN